MKPQESQIEKKIKRYIYGTPQLAIAKFPSGLGQVAKDEIDSILTNAWFPSKFPAESELIENEIQLKNIHVSSLTELLMRSTCLEDLRLVIFAGKTSGKKEFDKKCRKINWEFYLDKKMIVKIRVDSVASHAFHESGLKEILAEILSDHEIQIVSGVEASKTTILYVDLCKDYLKISISLAGEALYKRGYRTQLSASAPLREDAAACFIQKAFQFAQLHSKNFFTEKLFIPFSGTGTFAFEYLIYFLKIPPVLFERKYALQEMPLFRKENFNFLKKKSREIHVKPENLQLICVDSSENANTALQANISKFSQCIDLKMKDFIINLPVDFIKNDVTSYFKESEANNIFIPMNPPYGVRLNKDADIVSFYKNIAVKMNEIAKVIKEKKKHVLGFILCPSEESWRSFCKNLANAKTEAYHFNQGGLDIRVCQFYI
jgi:23S rRNA G2445 N2-methylase RlmL